MADAASITTAKGVSHHEMHGHAPKASPDTWIFNAEAVSTLLIAAWYIFDVFIALGLIPESPFHAWGGMWVIPMLLGVFYFGAGLLFQRYQRIVDVRSWTKYMRRETIVLLTPFFAFTILTLATSSLMASQPELLRTGLIAAAPGLTLENFIHAVFVQPVGPVGYFVVLLGLFIITRTPQTKRGMGALLAVGLAAKVLAIACIDTGLDVFTPYYLIQMMDNWIWFILGIALQFFKLDRLITKKVAAVVVALFIVIGAALFLLHIREAACLNVLTALGLACFYSLSGSRFEHGAQNRFFGFVTQYTMAIWLMHEILAQLVFFALFACGFSPVGAFVLGGGWTIVCAIGCLIACYPLSVLVMAMLSRIWKLGFIVYPARYLPSD